MTAKLSGDQDLQFMRRALALAEVQLGNTAPNPTVGCVLVKNGKVIAETATAPGGRPHAETQALDAAGTNAKGATAYVTLEPCAHIAETPPCVDALIAAQVDRVLIACEDPDPRTAGKAVKKLRETGIKVSLGVCEKEARELNAGFFLKVRGSRPLFTLKLAMSLDGKIATANGESQWITGERARQEGHRLRAIHDAILVGAGTVRQDNPRLTVRHPDYPGRKPVRVVLRGETPLEKGFCIDDEAAETWILDAQKMGRESSSALDVGKVANHLAERGLTRVLIEGGAQVAASFLEAGLVDQLIIFRASVLLGGDSLSGVGALGLTHPDQADRVLRFKHLKTEHFGEDVMECYTRKESADAVGR